MTLRIALALPACLMLAACVGLDTSPAKPSYKEYPGGAPVSRAPAPAAGEVTLVADET